MLLSKIFGKQILPYRTQPTMNDDRILLHTVMALVKVRLGCNSLIKTPNLADCHGTTESLLIIIPN